MTTEQEFGRLFDGWLAEGSETAPEHTIDRIADRIGRERQLPSWRSGITQTRSAPSRGTRVVLAAAVMALVVGAVGLATVLSRPPDAAPIPPTTGPSRPAAVVPTPVATVTSRPSLHPTPSPSPRPIEPRRAALVAPLLFTPKAGWAVIADSPNLLSLGYAPALSSGPFTTDRPTVTVGVPYGYRTVAEVLTAIRKQRFPPEDNNQLVSDWCPDMAKPKSITVAGISGKGFFCDGDASIDLRPLYPVTAQGRAGGVPAGLESAAGWLFLRKGDDGTSVIFEVAGKPVVLTVIGGHARGPGSGGRLITIETERAIRQLDLTFGR